MALDARLTGSDDTFVGTDDDDLVTAPANNANLQATDVLTLGAGTDTLLMERTGFLGLAASKLAGATGLDIIDMSAADDVRFAGNAALLAQSDAGTVTLRFDGDPFLLDLRDLTTATAGYVIAGTGSVTLADVDQIVAVADGIDGTILGGTRRDTLDGGTGSDSLLGGDGDDALRGDAGDDTLIGGNGHDALSGGLGDDVLLGGDGYDVLSSGGGDDTLTGGAASDVFTITSGGTVTITDFDADDPYEQIDLRAFADLSYADLMITADGTGTRVRVDDATTVMLADVDPADLTARSFTMAGQSALFLAKTLGAAADFTFTDQLDDFVGDDGTQIFDVTGSFGNLDPGDLFDGAGGIDTLRIDGEDRSLSIAKLEGMSGIEIIDLSGATGSHRFVVDPALLAQSDDGTLTLRHGQSELTLDSIAPAGAVTVEGTGQIFLRSEDGQAVTVSDAFGGHVTGGDSSDLITGGARDDLLDGGVGDDTIDGGAGSDTLLGGDGDDRFEIDGGDVTITGGAGHDVYVLGANAGRVTITDFDTTDYLERIDITALTGISTPKDVSLSFDGGDVRIVGQDLDLTLQGAAGARFGLDDFIVRGRNPNVFDIDAKAPLPALQSLISDAEDGSVIRLAAGTYGFTETLLVDRSHITIRGAGEGKTILRNQIADADVGDAEAHAFRVQPDDMETDLGLIASDLAEGATQVVLAEGHGLSVGDLVFINEPNSAEWLEETGNTGWTPLDPGEGREESLWLREFRSRIVEIDGDRVTLAEPSPYSFTAGLAQAKHSTFLTDVHLSDFTIQGRWGSPDPYYFDNTMDVWDHTTGLEFDGVERSSVSRVTTIDLPSHAFRFQRTHEVTGTDLTAIGAFNKAGSNGVHFTLSESFSNTLTGITSIGSRHAVEFSSYSAEHYNHVQVDFVDRDINFHGSPDADNTVIVDRMVMDYPTLVFPQWRAVSPGGFPLHPYPTIEENDVTFIYAETGDRKDIITGHDGGAYLDTGIDNDSLTGGSGDDTLIGGTEGDTLRGNGGVDRFVWAVGDGTDTILDLETGPDGDVIVLAGTGFTDASQLELVADGDQTLLLLGTYGEMRLLGITPDDFHADNIEFVDAPVTGLDVDAKASFTFLLGTQADDRIGIQGHHLDADGFHLVAGAGLDTVTVGVGRYSGAFHTTGTYEGVDIFDFSSLERGDIAISSALVEQSDEGILTLLLGDEDAIALTIGRLGAGQKVLLDGHRDVILSDNSQNVVQITDRIGGSISGGERNDTITGGARDDRIDGGDGDDRLAGGAGRDTLTGGGGSDDFVFDIPGDAFRGEDRITSFVSGEDRILLDIPSGIYPLGALPGSVFSAEGVARDRDDRVIYDGETGELSIDLNGSRAGGETVIAILEGGPDLLASDIFLI